MTLLSTLINKLKHPFITEHEEFINHIKAWFPISAIIGLVVGFVMSLFFIFIFLISSLFSSIPQLVTMIIGSTIILGLIKIGFEQPDKNGINYVIATKHKHEGVPLSETKEFVSSGIALGSGLPIGKEGPALVIGSAIATKISSFMRTKKDELHNAITIGSAAATGALFQAPLGSAVFASEVPYKQDSDEPMLMVSFLASVIAAVTMKTTISQVNAHLFPIDFHLFRIGEAVLEINFYTTFLALFLGVVVGYTSLFFIDLYYLYQKYLLSRFKEFNRVLIGVVISLSVIGIGQLLIDDLYLSRGISSFDGITEFIDKASINIIWVLLGTVLLQILATTAIIATGFPGGIFGPALSIGAMMGIIFAILLNITDPLEITSYAIIGMSASHAATTKTPIASVLLILEITGLPDLIIPIVMANIAAYVTSGHKSLYESQIHSRDANILRQLSQYDQLDDFHIHDVMTSREFLLTASPETTLKEFKKATKKTNKHTFPVVDGDRLLGIITIGDMIGMIDDKPDALVSEAMTKDIVSFDKDMTGRDAMYILVEKDLERCPVVEDDKIIGIVTIKDILRGHKKIMDQKRKYFA